MSRIRERIGSGEIAIGLIVRMSRTSEIATIAKASGHDFLFIDCQHAVYSPETVLLLLQASRQIGIDAVVRVRAPDDPNIGLWLDGGASGIVVPDLESVAQAGEFVRRCRFPPVGGRSFAGALQHTGYAPIHAAALDAVDREVMCIGMIETAAAVDAIDQIAAVDGLDVLHVGMNDLSLALGRPGEMASPTVVDAIGRVAEAASANGKILGFGGDRDPGRMQDYLRMGAGILTTESDVGLLLRSAQEAVAAARALLPSS